MASGYHSNLEVNTIVVLSCSTLAWVLYAYFLGVESSAAAVILPTEGILRGGR